MSAKHTPGPWNVHQGVDYIQIETPDGTHAITGAQLYPDANDEANHRLIAAAPETAAERDRLKDVNAVLLMALQMIRANYVLTRDDEITVSDAIAKAEGA